MPNRINNSALAICLLSILLLFFSRANSQSYKVLKIDSTARHYLISITDGESIKGIIVSAKVGKPKKSCVKVEIGYEYDLALEKYMLRKFINKTSAELYETSSLQGLFYIIK